jgi:hypothetical protein
MCGERNVLAKPVMRVYATGCRQQFYCFSCWFIISERAAVDVPDLVKDSPADAHTIGLLFGIKRELANLDEFQSPDTRPPRCECAKCSTREAALHHRDIDRTVRMRKSLIVDNVPFKQYMLTGAELESYKQKRGLGG